MAGYWLKVSEWPSGWLDIGSKCVTGSGAVRINVQSTSCCVVAPQTLISCVFTSFLGLIIISVRMIIFIILIISVLLVLLPSMLRLLLLLVI